MKRTWLGLVLLLPGGMLIALGLLAAWPGLALLVSGLRRMTAPTGDAGRADEVTTPTPMQPYGQSCQRSPRVDTVTWDGAVVTVITRTPWASYGDMASSTGRHWEES